MTARPPEAVVVADVLCACGLPLHYRDSTTRAIVESAIRERGPDVIATIDGRDYAIPRHYLALHCAGGLDGIEPARLGFVEVERCGETLAT